MPTNFTWFAILLAGEAGLALVEAGATLVEAEATSVEAGAVLVAGSSQSRSKLHRRQRSPRLTQACVHSSGWLARMVMWSSNHIGQSLLAIQSVLAEMVTAVVLVSTRSLRNIHLAMLIHFLQALNQGPQAN